MAKKSKLKIELNRAGVRELLRSQEMMNICAEHANSTQASLGKGYEVSCHTGKNRVNAEVAAVTQEAIQETLKNNSILKALK